MTTREHLERLYAEVCGPSLVYTRTDAELRTLWGGAK